MQASLSTTLRDLRSILALPVLSQHLTVLAALRGRAYGLHGNACVSAEQCCMQLNCACEVMREANLTCSRQHWLYHMACTVDMVPMTGRWS